jgi:8-oxo-dGTP pyrophosphatase MutT (NUDIX family)
MRLAAAVARQPGRGSATPRVDPSEIAADQLRPAAILVTVVDRPRPSLLLTRRTDTLSRHAGQVAFPGGRIDPEDDGPVAAALREAEEEVGLAPHHADVIGSLPPFLIGTGYSVTPVVALIPPDLPLVPREAEVAAVFEVPMDFAFDAANQVEREAVLAGRSRRYVEIAFGEWRIWGATAGVIVDLGRRLADG